MTVELPTEQHLEFLSLTGGGTGSSESTLVKMPHCWKSHVAAQMYMRMHFCYQFMVRINSNASIHDSAEADQYHVLKL